MYDSLLADIEKNYGTRPLLSIDDIREICSCSRWVVYNWLRRPDRTRRLPKIKVGKSVRVPRVEFVRFLVQESTLGPPKGQSETAWKDA